MKRNFLYIAAFSLLTLSSCANQRTTDNSDQIIAHKVDSLLKEMTLEEKLGQMIIYPTKGNITGPTGSVDNIEELIKEGKCGNLFGALNASEAHRLQKLAIENTRMKIPLLLGCDVIHGYKTIFPVNLGISASWDLEEIERFAGVCRRSFLRRIALDVLSMCDISRDPRWGVCPKVRVRILISAVLLQQQWYAVIKEMIYQKIIRSSPVPSISSLTALHRRDAIITRWTSRKENCVILISHPSKLPLMPEQLP